MSALWPYRWSPAFRRLILGLVLGVLLVVCVVASPAAAQSVWELTPYRIQVFLALGPSPELGGSLEKDLGAELPAQADALIGASWDMTVAAPAESLRRLMLADLEAVTVDSLAPESLGFDKVFVVAVLPQPTGYSLAARELDVRTRWFGTPVRVTVSQGAGLRDGLFAAVREAFAPLAEIASVDDANRRVTLRLRAASLAIRDAKYRPAAPGRIFQPIVRYDDREGNPRRISVVPWTYLEALEGAENDLPCALYSGLHSPLSVRRRGRVQQLALAVVPPLRPTRMVLRSRTDVKRALVGYDIYEQTPGSKTSQLLGRTDREGSVTVYPGEHPLKVLYVKHGGELLARLPLVPGLQAVAEAPVPDDDPRLAAEGYLMGLKEDVIDAVAARAILMPRAGKSIQAGQFDQAQDLVRQLQTINSRDLFLRKLSQERKKAVSDDPVTQRKIDAMFAETEKLINQRLDPVVIQELADQLVEARAAAAKNQ